MGIHCGVVGKFLRASQFRPLPRGLLAHVWMVYGRNLNVSVKEEFITPGHQVGARWGCQNVIQLEYLPASVMTAASCLLDQTGHVRDFHDAVSIRRPYRLLSPRQLLML